MLLKELSEAPGVSGGEGEVRKILREAVTPLVDGIMVDVMGNLVAYKEGTGKGPRVMVAAHMDEVGLMVAGCEKNGMVNFYKVGGLDDRVLVSKVVSVGPDRVPGVLGAKAIHLQKPEERKKALKSEEMYIDIGARDQGQAEKMVRPGDHVSFVTRFSPLGDRCVKGKALDDRVGCALLVELLKQEYPFPFYGVFTVQEELGMRGATVAAYTLDPDLALVLESTTAADVPGLKEERQVTTLGRGPALTFMDGSHVGHRGMVGLLAELGEKEGVPYQYRRFTGAGTDAGAISLVREGIPAAVVSVPCRYIHSPASLMSLEDYNNTWKLVELFLRNIPERGFK